METTDSSLTEQISLSKHAEKICFELSSCGLPERQEIVNDVFALYELCVRDNLPSLTQVEKLTIFAAFNGKISIDIINEIQNLPINVYEAYIYDPSVKIQLDKSDTNIEKFIQRIETWSLTQKIAVHHAAKAFWRKGQEWQEVYNGEKYL